MLLKDAAEVDHTVLDASQEYKVYKFVRELGKAIREIGEEKDGIIASVLTKEEMAKGAEYEIAKKANVPCKTTPEEFKAIREKYFPLLLETLNSNIEFPDLPKIPMADYFKLKKANPAILTNEIDALLDGVLWEDAQ